MTRYALCTFTTPPGLYTGEEIVGQIQAYLPRNYSAVWASLNDRGAAQVLIVGNDDAGWTLEDYIIPRLHTGLVSVAELHAIDPQAKAQTEAALLAQDPTATRDALYVLAHLIDSAPTS